MKRKKMILLITTTIMGLTAGIFYCWSISVTTGLAYLPDKEYITAFQALNKGILNPLFFVCFMGLVFLLPICTWQQYSRPIQPKFWMLLAASLVYIIGVIGITMIGNVPMNDSMEAFNVTSATAKEIADKRASFETTWNNLNNIRTLACIISLVLTILVCLDKHDIGEIK